MPSTQSGSRLVWMFCIFMLYTTSSCLGYYDEVNSCVDDCYPIPTKVRQRCRYICGIELLFWQTCVTDLDFALRLSTENTTPGSGRNCTKYKFSSPDFDPGLRGTIGIENICSDWDFTASLTYLCANKSKSLQAPDNGLALSTLIHGDFNLLTHEVKGCYWLHYWESDYLFTNRYWLDKHYSIDPFFGPVWAIFDQDRGSNAEVTTGDDTGDYTRFKWHGDYWGVGMKVGTQLGFHVSNSVNYYLRISGSLLAGETYEKSKHRIRQSAQTTNRTRLTFTNRECLIVPNYHITTGLQFRHTCCGRNVYFKCGYEFLNWHNMPSARRFIGDGTDFGLSSSPSKATIGFHGFFAGGGISF